MKHLILPDGSTWPDPLESKDSFNWAAKAYYDLIMGDFSLQQARDKISLIRQAAGRPRVPTRKSKKSFFYMGFPHTWQEIAAMGVDGLTRDIIVSRQRAGWDMERILNTPVRKLKPRKKDYKGFKNKEDYLALHECDAEQREVLGL